MQKGQKFFKFRKFIEERVFFEKQCFHPLEKHRQQNWRAEEMPLVAGRLAYSHVVGVLQIYYLFSCAGG